MTSHSPITPLTGGDRVSETDRTRACHGLGEPLTAAAASGARQPHARPPTPSEYTE